MRARCLFFIAALLGAATSAGAQDVWSYRARLTAETGSIRVSDRWIASHLAVASADGAWERARVKIGAGVVAADASRVDASLSAREGYARVSAASWLDLEAGKRLLRWGVGYGFAPTGVLDPPRDPADPSDRFGRREGVLLARGDLYAGGVALTAAAASIHDDTVGAMRVKTLVHGFDMSAVAAVREGARAAIGMNVTHVIGERLEWHAEVLSHDDVRGRERTVSAAAGLQYTAAGMNVVMEYHRRHDGNVLFGRAVRADADARIVPEMIVSKPMAGGGATTVASVGVRLAPRVLAHVRVTSLPGARALAAGATARF